MLFAHTFIQFCIVCIQSLLVVIVHFAIFSNKCKGLYAELVLLLILQGMVGATLGFFISAICSKEETAIELSIGLLFPIILLSGMFWSLEGMKVIPREIAKLLPMSYAIIAGRNIITRGWDMMDWEVVRGYLSSSIWIVLFWYLALLATILNDQ
uniref:ABC transporter G family member 20 n=1 Tax=Cacopsylla melanoneura TaxID=428564 RepID=A0A8D8ZH13_9HEMI